MDTLLRTETSFPGDIILSTSTTTTRLVVTLQSIKVFLAGCQPQSSHAAGCKLLEAGPPNLRKSLWGPFFRNIDFKNTFTSDFCSFLTVLCEGFDHRGVALTMAHARTWRLILVWSTRKINFLLWPKFRIMDIQEGKIAMKMKRHTT